MRTQRTDFEMEKLLHKYRVLARKRQIEMTKLENEEYPFEPYNIAQYQTPKRRLQILKVGWAWVRYLLSELKP